MYFSIVLMVLLLISGQSLAATNRGLCRANAPVNSSMDIQRLLALEDVFNPGQDDYRQPLDLVFILDRSKSLASLFDDTTNMTSILISHLIKLNYIFIHKNYTRISLISVAGEATSILNGQSGFSSIDACQVSDKINDITVDNFATESKISEALDKARGIFRLSRSESGRMVRRQVLWLFNDGECVKVDCEPYEYKGKSVQDWATSLREDGVKIFTAGVGEWLDHETKERRLIELVESEDYYACVYTWSRIIPELTNNGVRSAPRFSEVREKLRERICGKCSTATECACNVMNQTYTCTDEELVPLILPTSSPQPAITAPTPGILAGPSWLTPVAYGSSAGGIILLLLLIILLPVMAVKKRNAIKKIKKQRKYTGDMANLPSFRIGEKIYDDAPPKTNTYQPEPTAAPKQKYENVQDYQKNMDGWPGVLASIKHDHKLIHLAIHSNAQNRWAYTAGFNFSKKDFRKIETAMMKHKDTTSFKLADKNYKIDRLGETVIYATTKNKDEVTALRVSKVYDYIILGLAKVEDDPKCMTVVGSIHDHLLTTIESDQGHIEGEDSTIYEYVDPSRSP